MEPNKETNQVTNQVTNEINVEQSHDDIDDMSTGEPEREAQDDKSSLTKRVMDWVIPFVAAIAIALFIRFFVGGVTSVQGSSMVPTLHSGDLLIVNKLPTYTESYKRSDIVVIDAPDEPGTMYIKRIVGLPGETIRIEDRRVYVDGKLLREYYIDEMETPTYFQTEWTLAKDEYFVMGDNRPLGRSKDSRMFGPIKSSAIDGVAVFRIFPLTDMTGL